MKRFVFKFFLFLIPVAGFFLAMNALYERTNYWKSKDYANKYTDAPYGIELGNVGSSMPCYALKYDVVPDIKAWNFANVTEVYFWSCRILKNYINHFKKGAVILIEIPYFGIKSRVGSFRERYYRILPKEDMDYWKFSEWLAYSKFPLLSSGRFKFKIFHDISKEEMSPYYDRDSVMTEDRLVGFANNAYSNYSDTVQDGYAENLKEVSFMIDMCHDHGMTPILVTYPEVEYVNESYEDDPGFFESFERFTKELQDKYPGLVYLNYSHDENFTKRHEYYKDAVHMNNAGAEAFTLKLVGDLRQLGLLR